MNYEGAPRPASFQAGGARFAGAVTASWGTESVTSSLGSGLSIRDMRESGMMREFSAISGYEFQNLWSTVDEVECSLESNVFEEMREDVVAFFNRLENALPKNNSTTAVNDALQFIRTRKSVLTTFEETLVAFLEEFCVRYRWKLAELWAPFLSEGNHWLETDRIRQRRTLMFPSNDKEREELELFHQRSMVTTFQRGEGLPGRVYNTGKAEFLPCTTDLRSFLRADYAFRCRIKSALGLPVILRGKVIGVLVLFDTHMRAYDAFAIGTITRMLQVLCLAWTWRNSNADPPT